jgi:hypothetical protein
MSLLLRIAAKSSEVRRMNSCDSDIAESTIDRTLSPPLWTSTNSNCEIIS